MSDKSKRFTDNNLKIFYGNILNHYQDCLQRINPPNINTIYNEMFLATQFAVESPSGTLYHLDREEKSKVYRSFEAIFRALPVFTQLSIAQQIRFRPKHNTFNARALYALNHFNNYNCYDSTLFNWQLLSLMNYRCHTGQLTVLSSQHLESTHQNLDVKPSIPGQQTSQSSTTKIVVGIVLSVIVSCGSVLSLFALYYMLEQFLNSVERLCYNEGWLKAALLLANSLVFGSTAAVLTLMFASAPLIALAAAVGVASTGLIIAATVCLSAIGSGIGCFAMDLLYDLIDKMLSDDALDPTDPCRFRLTEFDEKELIAKHIDPIKAKCALVAIRAEISRLLEKDEALPSFLTRHFGAEGKTVQKLLQQAREVRFGSLTVVSIGNLCFDCRNPVVTQFNELKQVYQPRYFSMNSSNHKNRLSIPVNASESQNLGASQVPLIL